MWQDGDNDQIGNATKATISLNHLGSLQDQCRMAIWSFKCFTTTVGLNLAVDCLQPSHSNPWIPSYFHLKRWFIERSEWCTLNCWGLVFSHQEYRPSKYNHPTQTKWWFGTLNHHALLLLLLRTTDSNYSNAFYPSGVVDKMRYEFHGLEHPGYPFLKIMRFLVNRSQSNEFLL